MYCACDALRAQESPSCPGFCSSPTPPPSLLSAESWFAWFVCFLFFIFSDSICVFFSLLSADLDLGSGYTFFFAAKALKYVRHSWVWGKSNFTFLVVVPETFFCKLSHRITCFRNMACQTTFFCANFGTRDLFFKFWNSVSLCQNSLWICSLRVPASIPLSHWIWTIWISGATPSPHH